MKRYFYILSEYLKNRKQINQSYFWAVKGSILYWWDKEGRQYKKNKNKLARD